jgi:hypothetical protein
VICFQDFKRWELTSSANDPTKQENLVGVICPKLGRFRVNSNTHCLNSMYRRSVISVKGFRHVFLAVPSKNFIKTPKIKVRVFQWIVDEAQLHERRDSL